MGECRIELIDYQDYPKFWAEPVDREVFTGQVECWLQQDRFFTPKFMGKIEGALHFGVKVVNSSNIRHNDPSGFPDIFLNPA